MDTTDLAAKGQKKVLHLEFLKQLALCNFPSFTLSSYKCSWPRVGLQAKCKPNPENQLFLMRLRLLPPLMKTAPSVQHLMHLLHRLARPLRLQLL
jgi:hypothetical protein